MMRPTHIVGAALAGTWVASLIYLGPVEGAVLIAGAIAGDRIPDQDRRLNDGPNHRSLTHSLVLAGGGMVLAAMLVIGAFGFADGSSAAAGGAERPEAGWGMGGSLRGLLVDQAADSSADAGVVPFLGTFAAGGAIGYLAHLFLDSATAKRIWLLLPGGPRFGLPLGIPVGGMIENVLFLGLLCALGLALKTFFLGVW